MKSNRIIYFFFLVVWKMLLVNSARAQQWDRYSQRVLFFEEGDCSLNDSIYNQLDSAAKYLVENDSMCIQFTGASSKSRYGQPYDSVIVECRFSLCQEYLKQKGVHENRVVRVNQSSTNSKKDDSPFNNTVGLYMYVNFDLLEDKSW